MSEPLWVTCEAVRAIHGELIAEHGGRPGQPRAAELEAALARPRHVLAIAASPPPLARLAAAYGFAMARGQCFHDGNRPMALAVVDVFLQLNRCELSATQAEAAITICTLADGELTEGALADWIAAHSTAQ